MWMYVKASRRNYNKCWNLLLFIVAVLENATIKQIDDSKPRQQVGTTWNCRAEHANPPVLRIEWLVDGSTVASSLNYEMQAQFIGRTIRLYCQLWNTVENDYFITDFIEISKINMLSSPVFMAMQCVCIKYNEICVQVFTIASPRSCCLKAALSPASTWLCNWIIQCQTFYCLFLLIFFLCVLLNNYIDLGPAITMRLKF